MKYRITFISLVLGLLAVAASAADFGVHAGYYSGDLKTWLVGADVQFPIGPVAISPNIDYAKKNGIGWWFGNLDVDLRYGNTSGGAWWVGAGPTYGYATGYNGVVPYGRGGRVSTLQYGGGGGGGGTNPGGGSGGGASGSDIFGGTSSNNHDWGWDANAGISFKIGGMKPYLAGRYQHIKNFTSTSGAIGLRF
jgi:hypothetical protein